MEQQSLDLVLFSDSADKTLAAASRLKGHIEGIEMILNLEYDGVEDDKED